MKLFFILKARWQQTYSALQKVIKKWNFVEVIQNPYWIGLVLVVGLFPFLLILWNLYEKNGQLNRLTYQVERIPMQMKKVMEEQCERNIFFKRYQNADAEYLNQVFSEEAFLSRDKDLLELMRNIPTFSFCKIIEDRWDYLHKKNKLFFEKADRVAIDNVEESIWKQVHPIEIDIFDLKHLLAKMEGVTDLHPTNKDKPQLMIKHFQLQQNGDRKNYLLEVELMQRLLLSR